MPPRFFGSMLLAIVSITAANSVLATACYWRFKRFDEYSIWLPLSAPVFFAMIGLVCCIVATAGAFVGSLVNRPAGVWAASVLFMLAYAATTINDSDAAMRGFGGYGFIPALVAGVIWVLLVTRRLAMTA